MIPALTLIIGMYVVTRSGDLLRSEIDRNNGGPSFAGVMAMLTMVVTVGAVLYVFLEAHEAAEAMDEVQRAVERLQWP